MRKLSKEKRNQLVLVILLTGMALGGIWFGLINFQQEALRKLSDRRTVVKSRLMQIEQAGRNADRLENDLTQAGKRLAHIEDDMPSGDLYAWMLKNIGLLKLQSKVEIASHSAPEVKDVALLPKFPYRQVIYTIGGTAYYHDLGKFVADFENQYPYSRLQNLDIAPEPTLAGGDNKEQREKLTFHMEIVTLVKPGAS